jgi:putative DNA primase/helicase
MTEKKELPLGTEDILRIIVEQNPSSKPEEIVKKYISENSEAEQYESQLIEIVKKIIGKSEKYFSKEESPGKFVPERLANDIMERIKFLTFSDSEEVYWFDEKEGLWRANGEVLIKEMGTRFLEAKTKQAYLNETIGYIKSKTYTDRKIFDSPQLNLIPLQNGVLNLSMVQLIPYSPEHYFTSKLNVKYDPQADCPKIRKFLSEIVAADDVDLLVESAGYCLYRKYPIQKAFMLVGDGANGKSTYSSLLHAFLDAENISSVSLQDLERNRFASSNLYRKLANIYADLPSVALRNPGLFKMLTGGDTIPGEKKFKNQFFFVSFAKLIFSANRVPFVADESSAFFRRWVIVNFPFKFEGDKANPMILKELINEEELSGFLNLALKGLQKVLQKGFSYTKSTEETREAYIRASDPVGAFVLDCIIQSPTDYVTKDELYDAYSSYCRNRKLLVIDKAVFSKNLRRYVQVEDYRPTIEGKRVQAWNGIKLVNPVEDVKDNSHLNSAENTEKNKIKNNRDMSDIPDTKLKSCTQSSKNLLQLYKTFGEKILKPKLKDIPKEVLTKWLNDGTLMDSGDYYLVMRPEDLETSDIVLESEEEIKNWWGI